MKLRHHYFFAFLLLILFLNIFCYTSSNSSSRLRSNLDVTVDSFGDDIIAGSIGTTQDVVNFPIISLGSIHVQQQGQITNIYLADLQFCVVRKLSGGSSVVIAGNGMCEDSTQTSGIAIQMKLRYPTGVYLDESTNILYILDSTQIKTVQLETGMLNTLQLTYDPPQSNPLSLPRMIIKNNGAFYIADTGNNLVRKLTLSGKNTGILKTILGGLYKDPEMTDCEYVNPLMCQLSQPTSIAFSNVFGMIVTDTGKNRFVYVQNNVAANFKLGLPPISQPYHLQHLGNSKYLLSNGQCLYSVIIYSTDNVQEKVLYNNFNNAKNGFFGTDSKNVYFISTKYQQTVSQLLQSTIPEFSNLYITGGKAPYVLDTTIPATSSYINSVTKLGYVSDNEVYMSYRKNL